VRDRCQGAVLQVVLRSKINFQTGGRQVNFQGKFIMFNVLRLTFGFIFFSVSGLATSASAETVALKCAPEASDAAHLSKDDMTLTYEGGDSGTLTVKGSLGDMTLPATKSVRTGSVEGVNDGKPYSAIGIKGAGDATASMPEKAALAACIASKPVPEPLTLEEFAPMALMSCLPTVKPGVAKVPITASIEIAVVEVLKMVTIAIKRTYSDTDKSPGGPMTLETFAGNCSVVKP
jgi:hypothetical protein